MESVNDLGCGSVATGKKICVAKQNPNFTESHPIESNYVKPKGGLCTSNVRSRTGPGDAYEHLFLLDGAQGDGRRLPSIYFWPPHFTPPCQSGSVTHLTRRRVLDTPFFFLLGNPHFLTPSKNAASSVFLARLCHLETGVKSSFVSPFLQKQNPHFLVLSENATVAGFPARLCDLGAPENATGERTPHGFARFSPNPHFLALPENVTPSGFRLCFAIWKRQKTRQKSESHIFMPSLFSPNPHFLPFSENAMASIFRLGLAI